MNRLLLPASCALALIAAVAPAAAGAVPVASGPLPAAPVNLDFEQGELGTTPPGWQMTAASERAGYGSDLTDEEPYQGKACAVVRGISYSRTPGSATLMQSFDAAAYRGQRVRFRAAVRTSDSRAQLWLAVQRPNQLPGFFDDMADRPIDSNRWQLYEIVGEVAADAERIGIGLTVNGDGRAWIDAGSFETLGPSADAPPRPLTARGLTNLVAFARLLGYVRYFHPSDQAAAADWGRFAAAAVAVLDPVGTDPGAPADGESLAAALQRLFEPLAPTLRVFPAGRRPPPLDLGPPAGVAPAELRVVAWRHAGLGVSGGPSWFSSVRFRAEPGAGGEAGIEVDPRTPFAADLGGGASCLLPLAVWADAAGTLPHVAAAPSPENAGAGAATPPATATAGAGPGAAPATAKPGAGPDATPSPPGAKPALAPALPAPGAPKPASATAKLPPGAKPPAPGTKPPAPGATVPTTVPPSLVPVSPADRDSRLAIVMLAWNVLQHFDPTLAAGGVQRAMAWRSALPAALAEAAETTGAESLVDLLRRMVAVTDDGQATVVAAGDRRTYQLPLRWDWIEGQLVVTAAGAGAPGLRPGEAVTRIEGREVRSAVVAAEAGAAAATPQWRRWRALASLALGERGEPVRLDVVSPAAPALAPAAGSANRAGGIRDSAATGTGRVRAAAGPEAAATRAVTVLHTVAPGQPAVAEPQPEAVRDAAPGVVVVDLGRLAESELIAALPRLAAAAAIVFDLRGNVRSADALLAHLIAAPIDPRRDTVPEWSRPDREAVRYQAVEMPLAPAAPRLPGRLAFVSSARDVGAAETFLGAVAELHLGTIVGAATGGARGVIDSAPLPAGFSLIWTATRPAAGAPAAGTPVQPAVSVSPSRRGLAAGRDEVLDKALALVAPPAAGAH